MVATHIVLLLAAAKTSHEVDTLRAIPGAQLTVIGDESLHSTATYRQRSRRIPVLGSPRRWTAALSWLRGLDDIAFGPPDAPPDVVVSLEMFSVGTRQAHRLARRLKIPHLVYVTEILDTNPLYRLPPWSTFTRRSVREIDGVLCWNEYGARHAEHLGVPRERICTLSPGIDNTVFCPPTAVPDNPNPVVVTVGELRPDKGAMTVIAAVERARALGGTDVQLVIVGDGPLRVEIDQMAESQAWLHVRGRLARNDVANELCRSDVFALAPTARRFWAEQLGFAVIEAMACGLPVVVTRCGALDEVVPDHNWLVAEGDVEGLARGLLEALGEPGRAAGRANLQTVVDRYTLSTQGGRLGAQIEALVLRSAHLT